MAIFGPLSKGQSYSPNVTAFLHIQPKGYWEPCNAQFCLAQILELSKKKRRETEDSIYTTLY